MTRDPTYRLARIDTERLSIAIKCESDEAFDGGYTYLGTLFAKMAANARELEERVQQAEMKLALLSEEG